MLFSIKLYWITKTMNKTAWGIESWIKACDGQKQIHLLFMSRNKDGELILLMSSLESFSGLVFISLK